MDFPSPHVKFVKMDDTVEGYRDGVTIVPFSVRELCHNARNSIFRIWLPFTPEGRERVLADIIIENGRFRSYRIAFNPDEVNDYNLSTGIERFVEKNIDTLVKKVDGNEDDKGLSLESVTVRLLNWCNPIGEIPDVLKMVDKPNAKKDPMGIFHSERIYERNLFELGFTPRKNVKKKEDGSTEIEYGLTGTGCQLLGFFKAGSVFMTYSGEDMSDEELDNPENWRCRFVSDGSFMKKNEARVPGFEKRFREWLCENAERFMFHAAHDLKAHSAKRKVRFEMGLVSPYIIAEM